MTLANARERAEKLRRLIDDYRYNYHVLDRSIMSEAAADSLKHELAKIESHFPQLVTPDSPTQRVAGQPLANFRPVAHQERMLSLTDVFSEAELEAWVERVQRLSGRTDLDYWADIKMDGLACSLVYEHGRLVRAVTRGDGFTGEDVTANVRTLTSVPLALRQPADRQANVFLAERTEIRGEILMHRADFETLNRERATKKLPVFANPRNTAAGTIRQLDPRLVAQRPLVFYAYDLLRAVTAEVPTNQFAYAALKLLGFKTNTQASLLGGLSALKDFIRQWELRRHDLPFNSDGLVIKINDRQMFGQLGVAGKAPRGAVAFKYPAEEATTRVKAIFVSIGRTGSATPVAMLEPVLVAGSTVQMATLHNEGEARRKDIRVGDTVIVRKAGDVIPEVVRPLIELRRGDETAFKMPSKCPECATPLVKIKASEAVWRCLNDACPSRVWKRILHYASQSALDIEGLGEKNVIALIKSGLVKGIPDIYKLTTRLLLELPRFADKSAAKLISAIASKKQPPLHRFLYGLGIRHVGVQTALDLARHFKRLDSLGSASYQQLQEVSGVGGVVADALVAWFEEPANQATLAELRRLGVWPRPAASGQGPLEGKRFVITGSLKSLSREAAAEKIRSLGGIFQSSVAKDTDFLVVGANVGAAKLAKAKKLGIRQLNENEMLRLTGG